eukprot:GGOE01018558.1.p1 GENE.GGOE01018558.1~~GGOE01018558.1.p1  ORF type:complete len:390 (-),score=103.75 GGOE01018558.1:328-1455(-)
MAEPPVLRVGLLSTANISIKTVRAIGLTEEAVVSSVASRSREKAEQFAKEQGIEQAFGSYGELLRVENVDAIYIPLPTALHQEWVPKCIAAGKHVLVEKPVACTAQDLHCWLQQCRAANVAYMDGVMYMHHERLRQMREHIDRGLIGAAGTRHIASAFTFRGGEQFHTTNIRVKKEADPLGCLGDLGWYNIRLSLWAMNYDMPSEARGVTVSSTAEGVPLAFSGTLLWADDGHTTQPPPDLAVGARRTATFFCSFLHHWQQWAKLSGDAGLLEMDDFMLPRSEEGAQFTFTADRPHSSWTKIDCSKETFDVPPCVQEARMWQNFAALTRGQGDALFWMRVSLGTQLCLDALLESARHGGAVVPVDPENLMAGYQQ